MNSNSSECKIAEVIERAVNGDRDSQGELIEFCQDDLYRFCLYLTGNRALSQDIAQDTLIKALAALSGLKNPAALKGWLCQIARNLYLDFLKSPKNAPYANLNDLEETLAFSGGASEVDQALDISKTLSKLKLEEREVLLLVDKQGFSYGEAAQVLDITENALRSRLHRARQAFLLIFNETNGSAQSSIG
ncbi:MAG: RNA polymerase sigma factor [Halobacteriovoraceae bacterium]|jgi:RNA polymerase sigma-70 factor, ECF subfamily|nr:RNA polymerase sigma factor [Halobacteriovoraceae bacterium]MBT5094861.1 RNA polymerase sigma factor [Halobacteriovoraceae bacterium]